jgi:hypothetical protein
MRQSQASVSLTGDKAMKSAKLVKVSLLVWLTHALVLAVVKPCSQSSAYNG